MRRKTGKKPEVVDVVDVVEDDTEMETTLSEVAENNDEEQGMRKVSEAVERSLAKGLSDIVDMCEGRIELDYDDEDLEEGKDYEKELWEAFEELEALNNKRDSKTAHTGTKTTVVGVQNKQLASRKEFKTFKEEKTPGAAEERNGSASGLSKTRKELKTSQEEKAGNGSGLQSVARAKPSIDKPGLSPGVKKIEKPELKKVEVKKIEKPELKKVEVKKIDELMKVAKAEEEEEVPWFQRGIFFVCKSFIFADNSACGRRCNGRKVFKDHLTQGGILVEIGS